ncbi:AcvB/VirJ family lysyl-phosphatidylglycerol hydrolase [Shinella sp.]|uniref:AcvB/VirJ family lysyl-phosphatidylglycerol hydrolase n=1 Tax=Shinella sp. TaxID=1870904 RepID=UPI003F6FACE4
MSHQVDDIEGEHHFDNEYEGLADRIIDGLKARLAPAVNPHSMPERKITDRPCLVPTPGATQRKANN